MTFERAVVGGVGAVIGLAYLGLGVLAVLEVALERRVLGVSRFGLAFAAMAATCGPHHLVHGLAVLIGRATATPELAAATVVGAPAGLVFVALRAEAAIGGRGDRTIRGTPNWLLAAPPAFSTVAGALITSSLVRSPAGHAGGSHAGGPHLTSVTVWSNVLVAVAYSSVGWALLRTQVRRHREDDAWSLSGLSLAAVFPTCALMHVVFALTPGAHDHGALLPTTVAVAVDVVAIPMSLVFVWIVRALYREAIVDWNRRPAAGPAGRAQRPSPWASSSRT